MRLDTRLRKHPTGYTRQMRRRCANTHRRGAESRYRTRTETLSLKCGQREINVTGRYCHLDFVLAAQWTIIAGPLPPFPLRRQCRPSAPSPQVPPLMPHPLPSLLHRQCPSSRHVFCAGRALQQRGALAEHVGCFWLRTISNFKLQTLAQQTAG